MKRVDIFSFEKINFTLWINYLAIVYAFVLPLSRAGIGLISGLMLVVWLIDGNFKQKFNTLRKSKVVFALFLFILFNVVSLFWTEHLNEALRTMKRYWYLLPMLVLMTSLKKEYIHKVLTAFMLGMLLSEIISYGVFFELWEFKNASPQNPSPFMHHIEYSVFLSFTALILLSRVFNTETLKYKIFYAIFFLTVSGNLFLTAGRTGQLSFLFGLIVLSLLSFKSKVKALFITISLGVVVMMTAFTFSTTFHDRIIQGKSDIIEVVKNENYCTSWGGRVGTYIIAKDIIKENPLLGIGTADNMKTFHSIIDTKYPNMKCMHHSFMHVHNQYMQIWTALGLLGLLLFLSIFYYIIKIPIKDKELKHIKYVYVMVLCFSFIPEVLFGRQFSLALFALVVGLLLAQNRIENEHYY